MVTRLVTDIISTTPTEILYPDQSKEMFICTKQGILDSHILRNGLVVKLEHDILGNILGKSYFFQDEFLGKELFDYRGKTLLKSIDLEGHSTEYT